MREFLQIGNIAFLLESLTIPSACNKILRLKFLKQNTMGLIPKGGYTCTNRFSKIAMMWLHHNEQTDGLEIKHANDAREYRLPELPKLIVDGYCLETKTVYEFCVCFWYGQPHQPFRDIITTNGRYEDTITRLQQITRAG